MGRKLAKTVNVRTDDGEVVRLYAGDEPTSDQAEKITNPAAWAPESEEEVERNPDHSWPPDGGFSSMSDKEIFDAANSTSTSTEDEDDQSTLRTQKATGDHDPSETYRRATIPQLRALAEERDLDTSGITRRQEIVDLLTKADKGDAS